MVRFVKENVIITGGAKGTVPKERSGRCTICCSPTKTPSRRSTYAATHLISMALAPALHEAESLVTPASRDGNYARGGAECSANSRLSAAPSWACVLASSSLPANISSRTSAVSAHATRSGRSRAQVEARAFSASGLDHSNSTAQAPVRSARLHSVSASASARPA